jgi:tetratricopeptide (TPR) repeat protein
MRTGQLDQAVLLLEQNSAYLQQSTDSMALLAALYQQQKSHPKAIQLYRTLLQSDIQNGVWSMGLAVALDSMGKEKEARGYYEKAYRSGRLKTEALNFVRKKLGSDALQ